MKKIVILSLHLNYGGIEKFICDVANVLCEEHDVTIVTTYKVVDKPFFEMSEKVKIEYLTDVVPNRIEFLKVLEKKNPFKILSEGLKSVAILLEKRKTLRKYLKNVNTDVVITTRLEQSAAVYKCCDSKVLKIATEHNHHNDNKKYLGKVFNATKNMDEFVLLSSELYKFYDKLFKDEKVHCNNIKHFVELSSLENTPRNEVVSVGRLSVEKGFMELLDVAKVMKDTKFNIVGDGILKEALQQKIINEELTNVVLHGSLTSDVTANITKNCFAYAMTSSSESFGLVLIEALASGVPCVAFDDAKGPCEIIEHGVNGFLISDRDINSFADALYKCRDNFEDYSKNSKTIADKYSYDEFNKSWNDLVK